MTTTGPRKLVSGVKLSPEGAVRFVPAAAGPITVTMAAADNCDLHGELLAPDGSVFAAHDGKLNGYTFGATVPAGHPGLGQVWTLRLRNTGTVGASADAIIDYVAAIQELVVSRALLNEMCQVALQELKPSIALVGGHIQVHLDEGFDAHIPAAWRDHDDLVDVGPVKLTVKQFQMTGVQLAFVPAGGALPAGGLRLQIDIAKIKVSKLLVLSGGMEHMTVVVQVGFGVERGHLTIDPVEVTIVGDTTGLAALPELVGFDVGAALASAIEGKVRDALAHDLRDELLLANRWIYRLLRIEELLAIEVTTAGLTVRHTAAVVQPFPLSTQVAPAPTGRLQHLVVVMMENRSFDHMLGAFVRRGDVPGTLPDYQETFEDVVWKLGPTALSKLPYDPPHGDGAMQKCAAGRWVEAYTGNHPPAASRGEVLTFQPTTHVPTYEFLIANGCVNTNWRAALPGQTWPNRNYALSGTSQGILDNGDKGFDFYDFLNVCDVLSAQQVPWRYYRSDVSFLQLYRRWTFNQEHVLPLNKFHQDAAAGKELAAVTWIEPNIADFGAARATDDHPPADVKFGQKFLRDVYASLVEYSRVRKAHGKPGDDWLLVITYDENGGFYDSKGLEPKHTDPDFDDYPKTHQRGFRVPSFFVSPWLDRGACDVPLEHSSIVRTVLDHFCGPEPALGNVKRVKGATGFGALLDGGGPGWPAPRTTPRVLPDPPQLGPDFEPPTGVLGDDPPVEFQTAATPVWQRVGDRREALRKARAAGTGLMGDTGVDAAVDSGTADVTFEGIHVRLSPGHDPDQVTAAMPGWQVRSLFPGDRDLDLMPPQATSITDGWNAVHEVRRQVGLELAEPMWSSVLGRGDDPEAAGDADPAWPLVQVRAREAWQLSNPGGTTRGEGIVVAHLDTGLTAHDELRDVDVPGYGWDYVDDDVDPTDPLDAGPLWFPGHGTATASVLASRDAGKILGIAPAASLLVYRISRSVVHLSTRRMVAAIQRAVTSGAHVISLSAGGLGSAALRRAVADAVDAGVIVVAAAGNYVPFVVWPARYPDVIAVGAVDDARQPWAFSSRGDAVDVSAPGAGVWCARAGADPGAIRAGSGTSFATALVAGAIANWLGFHGRDALIARYGEGGLAGVARSLLARSAQPLAGSAAGMGAGILDLRGLLEAPLPDVDLRAVLRSTRRVIAGPTIEDTVRELTVERDPLGVLPLDHRATLADEVEFFAVLGRLRGQRWSDVARAEGSQRLRAML